MIAAVATFVFLAAAWLAIVTIARSLEDNFGKVRLAFGGEVLAYSTQPKPIRVSLRYPQKRMERVRALPALRAAA